MVRARVFVWSAFGLFLLILALFSIAPNRAFATTGINQELSFEGKIVNSSGINIPDGTYNMEFKIYSGGTATGGGTLVWTEDYLVGGTGAGVTFTSGTYVVNLGSVCSLSGGSCETYTNTGVNWNTYPLYLSLQIGNTSSCTVSTTFQSNCGGDGEMSPYILLTSTPYAFNSNQLGGIGSSGYVQTAAGNTIQPTTDAVGLTVLQNSAVSPTADIFDVKTQNATSVFQIAGPSANTANVILNAVGSNNNVTINPAGTGALNLGTLASSNTIQIGSTTLSSGTQTIQIGNNNTSGGTTNVTIGTGSSATAGNTTVQAKTQVSLQVGNASELITNNGITIQNSAGVTNAVQVQNSVGAAVFNVNTSLGNVDANMLTWPGTNTLTTLLPPLTPTSATFSGSGSGTFYNYEVVAVSANGAASIASPAKASTTAAQALSGTNTVALAWTAVTNATSYQIYRTSFTGTTPTGNSNTFGLIGSSTTNSFTDVGNAASGTTPTNTGSLSNVAYYFKVTAIDGLGGQSLPSTESTATTPSATNLAINVSWAPIAGARGYDVYYATSPGGESNGYFTTYTNSYNFTATTGTTAGSLPTTGTGYSTIIGPSGLGQITLGTSGTNTSSQGQLYVAGALPAGSSGSVASGSAPTGLDVFGNYAYVTNSTASTLQIIDVTNPSNPFTVSTVGTSTTPQALDVEGSYAYVVNSAGTGGANLQIINVSNHDTPSVVGNVSTVSVAAPPTSVKVKGNYAYILNGTSSAISNSLEVVNIANPASPRVVGSFTIGSGSGSQSLYIQDNYAYIVNKTANTFVILNITNPASITQTGSISTGTAPSSIFVLGRYAYITNSTSGTLQVFDISNPTNPILSGNVSTAAGSNSVYVQGNYAYVTNTTTGFLSTVDISNPSDPISVGTTPSVASIGMLSAQVVGRYAYVLNNSANNLQIYNVGGAYVQQLQTGGVDTTSLQVDSSANIGGTVSIAGSLNVTNDTQINGDLGVAGTVSAGTIVISGSVSGGFVTTSIATPAAPTVTPSCVTTCAGSYTYAVAAIGANGGTTAASTGTATAAGPTTFTNLATTPNTISWTPIAGAVGYNVYRTAGGTTQGKINTSTVSSNYFNDTALAGSGSAPAADTTNAITASTFQSGAGVALSLTGNAASTWSTTAGAITIQSGTGNIVLQAAGTGTIANIQIGAGNGGSGSTTPDLLVLDDNSSASDPTEVNGAMYYNANTNQFRCGEAGFWTDCIGGLFNVSNPATAVRNCTTACTALVTNTSGWPANFCVAGRVIHVFASGVYSDANLTTPTLAMDLYIGTNAAKASDTLLGSAGANGATTGSGVTNQSWTFTANIYCVSTTSAWIGGGTNVVTSATGGNNTAGITDTAAVTITNGLQNLYLFPAWQTASNSNTVTANVFFVQVY